MTALAPGSAAPSIPGVAFSDGPLALFFYKVTCPVCQMVAPKTQTFAHAYPGRIIGIGQDPEEKLATFDQRFGMSFERISDLPPYELSNAYGIRVVPTLFLVKDGHVTESVESWDRDGFNRVSRRLADVTGMEYAPISGEGDDLPPFRPG